MVRNLYAANKEKMLLIPRVAPAVEKIEHFVVGCARSVILEVGQRLLIIWTWQGKINFWFFQLQSIQPIGN